MSTEIQTKPAGKPTIKDRARQRICPECGADVPQGTRGRPRIFCCPEHKRAFNNRALSDGAAALAFLKAWRVDRGSGEIAKASLQRLCQMVDSFNEADREAGRPRADLYAAKLIHADYQPVQDLRYGRRMVERAKAREAAEA